MDEKETDILLDKLLSLSTKNQGTGSFIDTSVIPDIIYYICEASKPTKLKIKLLDFLKDLFTRHRFIIIYFAEINKKSVYIYLINAYLNYNDKILKKSLLDFISFLINFIDTPKNIYEYVYQNFSQYYRGIKQLTQEKVNDFLLLLNSLYGGTELNVKPKNYFSSLGKGIIKSTVGSNKKLLAHINFAINISFKIESIKIKDNNSKMVDLKRTSNLITIIFNNTKPFKLNFKYPKFLVLENSKNTITREIHFEEGEWIDLTLLVTTNKNKLNASILKNGEPLINKVDLLESTIDKTTFVTGLSFFEGFIGEFTSIMLVSNKNNSYEGIFGENVLKEFKNYKQGLWKKTICDKFMNYTKGIKTIIDTAAAAPKRLILIKKLEENYFTVYDDIIFIITPFTAIQDSPVIEDVLGNYRASYEEETIKSNQYKCFQKNIKFVGGMVNLIPIAELLCVNNNLLNNEIFNNYLSIIKSILYGRKHNIEESIAVSFFEIVSLFFEKYPSELFGAETLNSLYEIGAIFISNMESSSTSIYFSNIFMNEKILTKFSEEMQVKYWEDMVNFCQSDKTQIENIINMQKICLMLRTYDEERYTKMCCEAHYNQFKPIYAGNKAIMKPTMQKKLSDLKGILNVLIELQSEENVSTLFTLFKLLTLDLSPCLAKFIIEIFINAFKKNYETKREWCKKMVVQLFDNKCGAIIANTLRHSLLDVRLVLIDLLFEIQQSCPSNRKEDFENLINTVKTCIIPEKMFYEQNSKISVKIGEISELALHCASKMKGVMHNSICPKFKGDTIVFNDSEYQHYVIALVNKLLLWSIREKDINIDINKDINFVEKTIKYSPIIKLLIYCIDQIQDINLTQKFMGYFDKLFRSEKNCCALLNDKVFFSWILKTCYLNNNSKDKIPANIFNYGKNIIINSFINSIKTKSNDSKDELPFLQIETIFQWGDTIRTNYNDYLVLDFIHSILTNILNSVNSILTCFDKAVAQKPLSLTYIQKNYIILVSDIFYLSYFYKNDTPINQNVRIISQASYVTLSQLYLIGMRTSSQEFNKIESVWKDFNLFEDVLSKFSFIWSKENRYKKYVFKNLKNKNKIIKFEEIINVLVLNKDNKNLYLDDLKLLFTEFTFVKIKESKKDQKNENKKELVNTEPLAKILSFSLCNILLAIRTYVVNENFEEQYLKWLKQYKDFLTFLILSSSNLISKKQEEYYNDIQEKCEDIICLGLCFLKDEYSNFKNLKDNKIENKFKNTFRSLFTLLFKITNSQYEYLNEHKGIFNKIIKDSTNDLSKTAVFRLFNELILDKMHQPFLTQEKLKKYFFTNVATISEDLFKDDWKFALFSNSEIKKRINDDYIGIIKKGLSDDYFGIVKYKAICDNRFDTLYELTNVTDVSYQNSMFNIVKSYENELEKYSGTSSSSIKLKINKYRQLKKCLFSWNGIWSDQELFYQNPNKLKYKIINHYTKEYMKPFLMPILDVDYYLRYFIEFKLTDLFRENKNNGVNLDINSIFKNKSSVVTAEEEEKASLKNSTNYLKSIYRKSSSELSYYISGLKISSKSDSDKNGDLKGGSDCYKFLCCLVKQTHHIKGELFVDKNELRFEVIPNQKTNISEEDTDMIRRTCFGSYFSLYYKDLNLNTINIKYSDINVVLRRKYYFKNTAFELFTKNNKGYYFNFKDEKEREQLFKELKQKRLNDPVDLINDYKDPKDSFNNIIGYLNQNCLKNKKRSKKLKLSKQIDEWKEWKKSNFEMIMTLNLYSNRSYLDITQYPVFPWILSNYVDDPFTRNESGVEEDLNNYRDLSLPMGMLTIKDGGARKETFIETYESLKSGDEIEGTIPYFYGSNFSNPFYVTNFLTRLFPFTQIAISLQGQKFDNPDRLFISVEKAFSNSATQNTDIRELVPEFFYLPEMFLNLNKLNMGSREIDANIVTKDNALVDDVLIPWKKSPYEFVAIMREVLEGNNSNENISKWIDLIFGFKQRSEADFNIFTDNSYIDTFDINKVEDKEVVFRQVDFGLIPIQISNKECPKKNKKPFVELVDNKCNVISFKCKNTNENIKETSFVLKMQYVDNEKIALYFSNNTIELLRITDNKLDKKYYCEKTYYSDGSKCKFNYKICDYFDHSISNSNHIKFYNKGLSVLVGGFFNGSMQMITFTNNGIISNEIITSMPGVITAIEIDKDEEILFAGNSKGFIAIYQIDDKNLNEWKQIRTINDSNDEIVAINCNVDLNIWASSSKDALINLYTYPDSKLFRSFKIIDNIVGNNIFLVSSPLPCICILSGSRKCDLITYSINGKFIERNFEKDKLCSPIIMKDLSFKEYLVYVIKNNIIIRKLPKLDFLKEIPLTDKVTHISISDDMKIIYGFSADGTDCVLFKEKKIDEPLEGIPLALNPLNLI